MTATVDDYWNELQQVLALAARANALSGTDGAALQEAWDTCFSQSELVDRKRTESAAENTLPPQRVFCTNIYGLRYLADSGSWIPFRHGDVKIADSGRDEEKRGAVARAGEPAPGGDLLQQEVQGLAGADQSQADVVNAGAGLADAAGSDMLGEAMTDASAGAASVPAGRSPSPAAAPRKNVLGEDMLEVSAPDGSQSDVVAADTATIEPDSEDVL